MARFSFASLLVMLAGLAQAHELGTHRHLDAPATLDQAETYLINYRRSGDDDWLRAAEDFFARPAPSPTRRWRLLRAWHAQAQHRFQEASRYLNEDLTRAEPAITLLEANLKRVVGDHAAAARACLNVLGRQVLLGKACQLRNVLARRTLPEAGTLRELEMLARHLSLGNPEMKAWVAATLAEGHAARGDSHAALYWSSLALAESPTVQHRTSQARLLLELERLEAALATIGGRPEAPSLVLLRIKVLQAMGRGAELADDIDRLDRQFRQHIAGGDFLHGREMAEFYLDIVPDRALARRVAVRNWAAQKEPEDYRLLERTRRVRPENPEKAADLDL